MNLTKKDLQLIRSCYPILEKSSNVLTQLGNALTAIAIVAEKELLGKEVLNEEEDISNQESKAHDKTVSTGIKEDKESC